MKKMILVILVTILAVVVAMFVMSRCNPKQAEAELFLDFGYNNIEGLTRNGEPSALSTINKVRGRHIHYCPKQQ